MRLATAGGKYDMPVRGEVATSAALSVALHGCLLAALILTPQLFRPKFRELPSLGVITATIEGSGGPPRGGERRTQSAPPPLPPTPAPPAAKAVQSPPPRPADDLTIPRPGKTKAPPLVAKRDDLRPDFAPGRRQARPTPSPPLAPAERGLPGASLGGAEPGLDVTKKHGGTGGTGTGADPLLYYYARIKEKVSAFWLPSQRPDQDIQVLIGIRLLPGGQVREITIEASSGDRGFDEAAVRALRQALPLPPFPPLVKDESLNLILRFNNRGVGG